ncbi:MAG: protein kinase [bacterium]
MARKKASKPSLPALFADRYRIERELGRGGGGIVFLAEDLRLGGVRVALKVLDLKENEDPNLALALENEFRALTSLRHRNLARVLDFGRNETSLHLSSEWIDGVALDEAARAADLNTVFRLVVETLRALDYLHKRGVLHLDLKPANILVSDPGRSGELSVRLIDFGLAQWKRKGLQSTGGEFSGTPPYAAPEQILGQAVGPATDLYALGMILHRLFAKEFPFPSQDPLQIMQLQMYGEARRAQQLHEALPDSFADLLQRCVARDPARRFANAAELLQAINLSLEENFGLRDSKAPAQILEESDYRFRPELFERLRLALSRPEPLRIAIRGGIGLGKTRLLTQLKETLQLQGGHPLLLNRPPSPEEIAFARLQPLLWDWNEAGASLTPESAWVSEPAQGSCVLALPESVPVPEGFQTEALAPLSREEITAFLTAEIEDFPREAGAESILAQCRGRLDHLENLLQAMREEGLLLWGPSGWRWSGSETSALEGLAARQEARWKDRRQQVLELLRLAPLGMGTEAMAGILRVAPAVLETKLEAWRGAGLLSRRSDHGDSLWTVVQPRDEADRALNLNWEELQEELAQRYRRDEFSAGAGLCDLLRKGETPLEAIPLPIRILGARHYAAMGRNEDALALLPKEAPADPAWAGLHWEIRTRSLGASGKIAEAGGALDQGLENYRAAGDSSGLARLWNMKGWLLQKEGRLAEALPTYERSLDFAIAAGDRYAQGQAELNMGCLHQDQGQLELAGKFYDRALESGTVSDHPLLQIKSNLNRINWLYTAGRVSEAEAACYEMLRLALRQNYPEEQAKALNFLALFAGQRGDHERQGRYLDQALATLGQGATTVWLPQLHFNRAHLHWNEQRYTAAQLDAEAALASATRLGVPFLTAWCELLLGKILRDRRKPDFAGAERLLSGARDKMRKQKVQHLLWEAEFDLGLLAKRRGDRAAAGAHFLDAKRELEALLPQLPEGLRQSYLRDRKLERINEEFNDL